MLSLISLQKIRDTHTKVQSVFRFLSLSLEFGGTGFFFTFGCFGNGLFGIGMGYMTG